MKPYLLALVAFLVGGACGYVLSPSPQAAPKDAKTDTGETGTTKVGGSNGTNAVSAGEPPSDVVQALADSVELDLPPRYGRIEGTIALPDGEPLAGVLVTAHPRGTRLPKAHEHDFEAYVRRTAEIHQWATALRGQARTDSDGSFVLEELGDVEYRISPVLKGYRFKTRRGPRNVTPDGSIAFVATPLEQLRVAVTMPDGSTPNVALVRVIGRGSKRDLPWSREQPLLDLESGRFSLQASVADRYQSSVTRVQLPTADTVVLALAERPGVEGAVSFPAEEEIESAFVVWAPGSADEARDHMGSNRQHTLVSTKRPEYSILDLPPGPYSLGVVRRLDESPARIYEVQVEGAVEQLDLELEPLDRGGVLVVRVSGSDQGPPPKANYSVLLVQGKKKAKARTVPATRRVDGSDWLRLAMEAREVISGDRPGRCSLRVQVRGWGERVVELNPEHLGGQLEVVFESPATMLLTVRGTERVGPLSVELFGAAGPRSRGQKLTKLGASGTAHLGPVQPGSVRVRLVTESATSPRGVVVYEGSHILEPGDNEVAVQVPELYELEVSVEDDNGTAIVLRSETGAALQQARIFDGSAKFRFLKQGDYGLELMGKRGTLGQMVVSVPTRGEVSFGARLEIRLRVTVTDSQGDLARAGFKSGDFILGIEGKPFRTPDEAMGLLEQTGESVNLLMERDGERMELEVVPSVLRAPTGGKIRPAR